MSEFPGVVISKDDFLRFRRLQESGRINMISRHVQELAGLTYEQHMELLSNYEKYEDMYGEGD